MIIRVPIIGYNRLPTSYSYFLTKGLPKRLQFFVAHLFFPELNSASETEPLQVPLHT